MLVGMIFVLSGCNANVEGVLCNNVSEYCEDYFVGETQDYNVELFDGEREEPYYLDGVSERRQRYCLLVVTPKDGVECQEDVEFCVERNADTIEGGLNVSPFEDTMSAEVDIDIASEDNIFVYIKLESSTQVCKMQCMSSEFQLTWQEVLTTTYQNLSSEINALLDTHGNVECYLQVINKEGARGLYYWCITLIFDNGDKYTCIVDTVSGKILAKNL